MNRTQRIFTLILTLALLSGLAITGESQIVEAQTSAETPPTNVLVLDVTYDPATQNYSLSGFSKQQLAALGIPELQGVVWTILANFSSLRLEVSNNLVNLKADDQDFATINWDPQSRQLIYGLLGNYGVALTDLTKTRLETWISTGDVVLNIHNSPDVSKPVELNLKTLLMVDVGNDGKLSVEGFDTGYYLQQQVKDIVSIGGIKTATVCWSKGVLSTDVNGAAMPQVTLFQGGFDVVNKAMGLGLGDLSQFFGAQVGANVAFDGAEHTAGECTQP